MTSARCVRAESAIVTGVPSENSREPSLLGVSASMPSTSVRAGTAEADASATVGAAQFKLPCAGRPPASADGAAGMALAAAALVAAAEDAARFVCASARPDAASRMHKSAMASTARHPRPRPRGVPSRAQEGADRALAASIVRSKPGPLQAEAAKVAGSMSRVGRTCDSTVHHVSRVASVFDRTKKTTPHATKAAAQAASRSAAVIVRRSLPVPSRSPSSSMHWTRPRRSATRSA